MDESTKLKVIREVATVMGQQIGEPFTDYLPYLRQTWDAAIESAAKHAEDLPAAKDDEELWTPMRIRVGTAIRALKD